MPVADHQYHLKLNGQGYILHEETYRRRAQQARNPRFATGDDSLADLSFWQFLGMTKFDSEGQLVFEDTTKYRQSSGWDMRDGLPRLGRGIESLSLTASLPAVLSTVSFAVFDDFEAGFDTTKWNACTNFAFSPQGVATVSSVKGGYNALDTSGNGATCQARGSAANSNNNSFTGIVLRSDSGIADTGTWEFKIVTSTSGVNHIHVAVLIFGDANGSYVIEFKGSNMTSWVVKKTPNNGTTNPFYDDNDTTVATLVATGGSATSITVKVTRDSSGNWEVFENGASLGTFTDNTYTTTQYFGFKVRWAANTPTSVVDDVSFPAPATDVWGQPSKFLNYYNALYTCWDSGGSSFAFTTVRTASTASNIPKVVHQNAKDICVWNRDGSPTGSVNAYLASVYGSVLRAYNGETQVLTTNTTIVGTCVIPLSSTKILVMGTTAANNGVPAIEIITMDAEAWTVTSQVVLIADGATSGTVAPYAAFDTSGSLYFCSNDMSANLGTQPSRLFVCSAADLTATRPTITAMYTLTDFTARGVFSLQGTVYIFGARRRGTDSFAAIMKASGLPVWESTKAVSLASLTAEENFYNHGVPCVWKNFDHVLFLGMNDAAVWDPVLQLDAAGDIREVAAFVSGQFSTALPNACAVAEWNGAFYYLNAQAGTIKRTTTTRGGLGADFSYIELELSQMGENTQQISKALQSVKVELSAALTSGTLTVIVNGTTIGTMTSADGTSKEMTVPSALVAASFTTKLRLTQDASFTGYVKGVLLKYVPSQFKKLAWTFAIRADRNLVRLDGTRETATPAELVAAVKTAWESNVPVTLLDRDGTSKSVIVTDFDERTPLLKSDRAKQEALVFVEALEA
jgi:hypothetical protein